MKKLYKAIIIVAIIIVGLSMASTACLAYNIENSESTQYKIDIIDEKGNKIPIYSSDIDLKIRLNSIIDPFFSNDTKIKLVRSLKNYNLWINYNIDYNKEKLIELIKSTDLFSNDRVDPINAYINIDTEQGTVEIIDSIKGTVIDEEKILEKIDTVILNLGDTFNVADTEVYKEPDINKEDLQEEYNNIQDLTGFTITYTHNNQETKFDQGYMLKYINKSEDGTWYLSDTAIDNFVDSLYNKYNTYGRALKFTTTDGRNITVPGGNWGWKMNKSSTKEALRALIEARQDATGEISWSQTAPLIGDKEFVNYVEIDMGKQHLYLYNSGELIGDWDIVTGMANDPGRRTPEGVYILNYKTKDAVLRGPTWESPVKYWMPFNGGIGMHDASWQPSFGGEAYKWRGSHGCINMPLSGAKKVYEMIDKTYAIICFY